MARGGKRLNAGRPRGSRNEKVRQWEELHESIVGEHAEAFNEIMNDLFYSENLKDRKDAAEFYIKVLEYFKPKYSRIQHSGDNTEPLKIIVSDKI